MEIHRRSSTTLHKRAANMNYKDLQQTVDGGFSFTGLNSTKISAPNSLSHLLRPYLGHVVENVTFYLTTERTLYEKHVK